MANNVLKISDDFWNIRGSFKIAGMVDIGTHASLIRQSNGKFVFLDSYTLSGASRREVDQLTSGGADVEAVLNLHPFHTMHVEKMVERYPDARHYGTARHLSRFPDLPWQDLRTEDPALHALFAQDFDFSIPRGVDFISADEHVHFSSVLVLHRASMSIHSDDTLMYIRFPMLLNPFGLKDAMTYHPTLAKALEKRAGAADDFQQWAEEMTESWKGAENLCAAHTTALTAGDNQGASIHARLIKALDKVSSKLDTHASKFG